MNNQNFTSELQLQAACYQWAWNSYPHTRRCFFHIPNGGHRSKVEAAQFKASGVLAGVHDMPLYWKSQLYWFEFKVGRNSLTPAQLQFKTAMEAQGAICYEIRDLQTFQSTFKSIIHV
jgi:hypothetical protein